MKERLTERNSDGSVGISDCRYYNYNDFQKIARKLADYEDLEEQGRLIISPCKVGDTVYHIRKATCENIDGSYTICEFYRHSGDNLCALPKGKCPNQYRIAECCVSRDNLLIVTEKWGKTVFLTKEQAEQKLKERKEDESNG